MSATLWDSFEEDLKKAEDYFLDFQFEQAIEAWNKYYKITAKVEYQSIIREIEENWNPKLINELDSIAGLYTVFTTLQQKRSKNKISEYTYKLYKRLLIILYKSKFSVSAAAYPGLEYGVFEYLCGNLKSAATILEKILTDNPENIQARVYLGFSFLEAHKQKEAIQLLTENLFLAPDKLPEEGLYLSQFKLLFGKLFANSGNRGEAAWLLTFESWYRNYLIFRENKPFFRIIQTKESNERIVQVKYHSYERYRHFMRCLYIVEYTRHFNKEQRGLIQEQENYMLKLDRELFARYRKKRKEV